MTQYNDVNLLHLSMKSSILIFSSPFKHSRCVAHVNYDNLVELVSKEYKTKEDFHISTRSIAPAALECFQIPI